jgi:hypothetical protein
MGPGRNYKIHVIRGTMSLKQFYGNHISLSLPLMIQGGCKDWPLLKDVFERFEDIGFENFMSLMFKVSLFDTNNASYNELWEKLVQDN